jgi:hypothetical protein
VDDEWVLRWNWSWQWKKRRLCGEEEALVEVPWSQGFVMEDSGSSKMHCFVME